MLWSRRLEVIGDKPLRTVQIVASCIISTKTMDLHYDSRSPYLAVSSFDFLYVVEEGIGVLGGFEGGFRMQGNSKPCHSHRRKTCGEKWE